MIAVARITMPKARVRMSAGRQQPGRAVQALCFMAGANSIFMETSCWSRATRYGRRRAVAAQAGAENHQTTETSLADAVAASGCGSSCQCAAGTVA